MKKYVSFILCVTMFLTSSIPAFAKDNFELKDEFSLSRNTIEHLTKTSLENDTYIKIKDSVHFLTNAGIGLSNLQDVEVKEYSIVYTYILDHGIESIIDVREESNGDMVYYFSENEKENELIIATDGKLYLEGNEVIVEFNEKDELDIQPMSTSYNTINCPRGVPSDYTNYYYTQSTANIELGIMIVNITVGAFGAILAYLMGPDGGWVIGISGAVAAGLITNISQYDPYTTGLSVIAKIYSHKDGPYMGTIYRRYNNTWYSRPYYGGTTTNTITYRVTEY